MAHKIKTFSNYVKENLNYETNTFLDDLTEGPFWNIKIHNSCIAVDDSGGFRVPFYVCDITYVDENIAKN